MRTFLIWAAVLCCGVGVFAALWPRQAVGDAERKALAEGRTIIQYWDRHQGHEHDMRLVFIDEFNRSQNRIYIRAISVGYNSIMEKLLTAIAGSAPPDLCSLESTMLAQLASQGCLMPLEGFMASDPEFARDNYFPHAWESVAIDGHVWGVPTTTDVYCLLWNKNAFRVAGLEPERPPRTFEELHEYAEKLTIRDGDTIEQAGFIPWQPWDMTGMWGLVFGGRLCDERGEAVCGNDPAMVRMMDWQQSFAADPNSAENPPYAMDPEAMSSFTRSLGAYMSANNPFYSGKVAMMAEGEWQVTFIPKYAPNLDWGVAPLPTPEGVEPMVMGWPCVVDCIPRGSRHPEEAWQFIKWFYSARHGGGPSPASDYCYAIHNICPRKQDALQARFTSNPKFKVFVDVLFDRKVVSLPAMPLIQFYTDELERQRERVVFRKTTPEEALMDAQQKVNAELERQRRFVERSS